MVDNLHAHGLSLRKRAEIESNRFVNDREVVQPPRLTDDIAPPAKCNVGASRLHQETDENDQDRQPMATH
jgi:hypothetical protein